MARKFQALLFAISISFFPFVSMATEPLASPAYFPAEQPIHPLHAVSASLKNLQSSLFDARDKKIIIDDNFEALNFALDTDDNYGFLYQRTGVFDRNEVNAKPVPPRNLNAVTVIKGTRLSFNILRHEEKKKKLDVLWAILPNVKPDVCGYLAQGEFGVPIVHLEGELKILPDNTKVGSANKEISPDYLGAVCIEDSKESYYLLYPLLKRLAKE